jgi:hypothetical protein
MQSLHKVLLGMCLLAVWGLGNMQAGVSPQKTACYWQLTGSDERLSSAFPGMSASRSGNTIQTAYQHAGNMGCAEQTFETIHRWSEPGNTLSPGDTLTFDVSVDWSLDGSSDCTSLTAGVKTSILTGVTRIVAERSKIIVSKEPNGAVSNSGSWVVPAGSNIGETLTITVLGDGGGVGGSVIYSYQWVCPAQAVSETPEKQATHTPGPTPTACPAISSDAKLTQILNRYYAEIPRGITDSGNKNNILSLWDKKYEEYVCGSYQGKVLQLLSEIKFNPDPCISAWMDDWDYGPIESLWGGHQAVVIYPAGTTWTETGLVLDPWITQTPKMYPIEDWSAQFSAASQYGIRGSSDYEKQAQYPTVGGAYAPPGELKLTAAENEFIRSLPEDKQEWLKKISPVTRKAWLVQTMRRQKQNVTVSVNSPLDVYLTDDAGHYFGIKNGNFLTELADVSFRRFLRSDGHYWTELEYPADSQYRLVMYGTDDGQARVFATVTELERAPQVYQYDVQVRAGEFYQAQSAEIGASILGEQANIQPQIAVAPETAWIESQPGLAGPEKGTQAGWDLPTLPWLLIGILALCCLSTFVVAGLGLALALFMRGRKRYR